MFITHKEPDCHDPRCYYPDPHRHGLDCDKTCSDCKGYCSKRCPANDEFEDLPPKPRYGEDLMNEESLFHVFQKLATWMTDRNELQIKAVSIKASIEEFQRELKATEAAEARLSEDIQKLMDKYKPNVAKYGDENV